MSDYSEKLKDPRWQKIRLQIFDRDDWSCQSCYSTANTLHVHHKFYDFGKDPWEYDLEHLVTLCEECHSEESRNIKEEVSLLVQCVKKKFMAEQINCLARGFNFMTQVHSWEVIASALEWILVDADNLYAIVELFFDHQSEKTQEKRDGILRLLSHEGVIRKLQGSPTSGMKLRDIFLKEDFSPTAWPEPYKGKYLLPK